MKGMSEEDLDDDDLEFELPSESGNPICEDYPLFTQNTNTGINLYWAPRPFNTKSGKT